MKRFGKPEAKTEMCREAGNRIDEDAGDILVTSSRVWVLVP